MLDTTYTDGYAAVSFIYRGIKFQRLSVTPFRTKGVFITKVSVLCVIFNK